MRAAVQRHTEIRGVPCSKHRILCEQAWILGGVGDGDRRARLDNVAGRASRRRKALSDYCGAGLAAHGAHDELVAFEDLDR
jgi:hypothetical protein